MGIAGLKILLVVGGGIAAYKACELVRLIRKAGGDVTCVITAGGQQFVTPMALAALTENQVYTDLWDLKDEAQMGHIQLSREADLVVVCPATANLIAKMAAGIADDLATTLVLATDKPIMIAPAMNVRMWEHLATQRNIRWLEKAGIKVVYPAEGHMACGEFGLGRLQEPELIFNEIIEYASQQPKSSNASLLKGRHMLVTAGPTHEAIDPVRYIANRSSGKQGFAIAAAGAELGAKVTLITGPVSLPTPRGVTRVDVETAVEMSNAVSKALPADIAVMVAAVADWRPKNYSSKKIKKTGSKSQKILTEENPDILSNLGLSDERPALLVGFAAETENVRQNAQHKRLLKGADWIVANDVSGDVMGGDNNQVLIVSEHGVEELGRMSKQQVASNLVYRMANQIGEGEKL